MTVTVKIANSRFFFLNQSSHDRSSSTHVHNSRLRVSDSAEWQASSTLFPTLNSTSVILTVLLLPSWIRGASGRAGILLLRRFFFYSMALNFFSTECVDISKKKVH